MKGVALMRIILKIIAAPVAVILTIAVAMSIFLFVLSEKILSLVSGLMALIGIAYMIFERNGLEAAFSFSSHFSPPRWGYRQSQNG